MFVPAWLIVAVIWFCFTSEQEKNAVVLAALVLVLSVVVIAVCVVAGFSLYDWWINSVSSAVKGWLFLVGLVLYIVMFSRWIREYRKLKIEMRFVK